MQHGRDDNEEAWQIGPKEYMLSMLSCGFQFGKDSGNGKKHRKSHPGDFFGFHLTLVLLHYRGY
jgi:hypothetical protein